VRPELLDQVLRELHDARIPPALIALEITESSLLGEDPVIAETLESLHRAGIALSVDDFGTGYSSLGYLKRFPVTSLKLDRVFVQGATFESDKRAITEAVLAMARELGLHVVAEGVETEEQLRFLAERGCQAVQGYLFAKPLREAVFTSWLARS
jgi:EAL domain-containing protein (putative c-di-GMP-specific phosphodiesterase class I)